MNINITVAQDKEKARELVQAGFCPIECSLDDTLILDELKLHKNANAHSKPESACIAAYKEYYGRRSKDPRFIISGDIDANKAFAIAALAGLLPHPINKDKDLSLLAEMIHNYDDDFITDEFLDKGMDLVLLWSLFYDTDNYQLSHDLSLLNDGSDRYRGDLFLWNLLYGQDDQLTPKLSAVYGWGRLTNQSNKLLLKNYRLLVSNVERKSRELIENTLRDTGHSYGKVLTIVDSLDDSPEINKYFYTRNPEFLAESAEGWEHPVILMLSKDRLTLRLGCPNDRVGKILFGESGLRKPIYMLRERIVDPHKEMTDDELEEIAIFVKHLIKP